MNLLDLDEDLFQLLTEIDNNDYAKYHSVVKYVWCNNESKIAKILYKINKRLEE